MLALKLFLVPAFLLLVSLAAKRWGPSVAGWLAGLPVVAGPILFFLAADQGAPFAAHAAVASLSAVFASVAFSLAYAHAARHLPWWMCMAVGLLAWGTAALCLSVRPLAPAMALVLALLTLVAAPRCFPRHSGTVRSRSIGPVELGWRMLAGAVLTLAVTLSASHMGSHWSGLLAVFPILGLVLAVFSHRNQGAAFAAALLQAMVTGLYAFVAFCFSLAVALLQTTSRWSFTIATITAIAVQIASKRLLTR